MITQFTDNMTVHELLTLQNHYLGCLLAREINNETYDDYEKEIIAAINKKIDVTLPNFWVTNREE